jgi:calcineurin-like phosphoesterase family protein
LMGGNHHAGFKQLFAKAKVESGVFSFSFLREGGQLSTVYFLPNYFEITTKGQNFVLSHYPILSWNGQAKGSIMVHGHCHGSLSKSELGGQYILGSRTQEVTVEVEKRPVSLEELKGRFSEKEAKSFDHHEAGTQNPF